MSDSIAGRLSDIFSPSPRVHTSLVAGGYRMLFLHVLKGPERQADRIAHHFILTFCLIILFSLRMH
jgi:hypothetical protein